MQATWCICSKSTFAIVLTQEVKAPGGFPAASQTANLFQSQPSQTLVQGQSGPMAEPGSQNLPSSGVPISNLFGNLAAPASSSAFAFGASAGIPSSNLFGNLSVPPSSSAASPAALFGGLSSAGSQALPLFGSAPANAFSANTAAASSSVAAETGSAAVNVGLVSASRQGSGLFGFGSGQPNQQGSEVPGLQPAPSGMGSVPASSPFGMGLSPSGTDASPASRQPSLQESALPSASSTAAGHSSSAAPPDDPPDPSQTPNSTPQPLPLGKPSSGAGQFGRAASLQVPSAFGATQDEPFGKGPAAASGGIPVQPWGKGKGPADSSTSEGEVANVQAPGKVSCVIADSMLSCML